MRLKLLPKDNENRILGILPFHINKHTVYMYIYIYREREMLAVRMQG